MQDKKPKLVDYNLINFPKKQISNIQKKILKTDNTKLYVNIAMVIILFFGLYLLYYRMKHKIQVIEENNANILFMSEYINQSIDAMYNPILPDDDLEELNQPTLNQPALNQPALNQPALNQPALNQPALNQTMPASKNLNL